MIIMGKIYNKDGKKMNVTEICEEVVTLLTEDEAEMLKGNYVELSADNPLKNVAHTILDTYKYIESTSERGQRLRKLLDNIMTKYQKSSGTITEEDSKSYRNLINTITE